MLLTDVQTGLHYQSHAVAIRAQCPQRSLGLDWAVEAADLDSDKLSGYRCWSLVGREVGKATSQVKQL